MASDVVREAIVNAVAHRDYASAAAVQVSVFADRVEVWNPGELPPELTPARLREPHASVARNARICEALFLARYIEKYGTGTIMMIRECSENGLPEPEFEQRGGEFVITLWRDWLTEAVMEKFRLNERQKKGLVQLRAAGRITNADYQRASDATRKTSMRDLADLVKCGLLERIGTRKGAYYRFARKRDIYGTYGTRPGASSAKSSDEKRSDDMGHLWDKRDTAASTKKSATNAPAAGRSSRGRTKSLHPRNASMMNQRPQRETRHKPAKAASTATRMQGDKKRPKGPGLKRLTKTSRKPRRRTRHNPDKGQTRKKMRR